MRSSSYAIDHPDGVIVIDTGPRANHLIIAQRDVAARQILFELTLRCSNAVKLVARPRLIS